LSGRKKLAIAARTLAIVNIALLNPLWQK